MEIKVRTYESLCEVEIESENTKIVEDVTFRNRAREYEADEELIEQLITCAFDMNRFNGKSDVDLVKEIFECFLNNHEKECFIEELKSKE